MDFQAEKMSVMGILEPLKSLVIFGVWAFSGFDLGAIIVHYIFEQVYQVNEFKRYMYF